MQSPLYRFSDSEGRGRTSSAARARGPNVGVEVVIEEASDVDIDALQRNSGARVSDGIEMGPVGLELEETHHNPMWGSNNRGLEGAGEAGGVGGEGRSVRGSDEAWVSQVQHSVKLTSAEDGVSYGEARASNLQTQVCVIVALFALL